MRTLKNPIRHLLLITFSVFLFVLLLFHGFLLAKHKPLWVDELYTQTQVVERFSAWEIIEGQNKGEPNRCPLFNLLQKSICKITGYTFPHVWREQSYMSDSEGQILLRIVPVVAMSLSLVILFYFFANQHSIGLGIYAFFLGISSRMVWQYMAEARSYSLWFLLTVLQILILMKLVEKKDFSPWLLRGLICIHILLSLTFIISLGQICISVFLYWFFSQKKKIPSSGKERFIRALGLFVVPAAISLYYYVPSRHFGAELTNRMGYLIFTCIPKEQMTVIGFFIVICAIGFLFSEKIFKLKIDPEILSRSFFVAFLTLLYLGMSLALMLFIKYRRIEGAVNAPITVRHFIYLTPLGLMAVCMAFKTFLEVFKNKIWVKINIIVLFVTLALMSFFMHAFPILRTF